MNDATYRMNFPVREQDIVWLREQISRQLHDAKVPGDITYAFVNVIDEICCNMMEYSEASWMEVKIRSGQGRIEAVLRDNGVEFDTTAAISKVDPGQPATVTERRLGLYMVGLMAKDLTYRRDGKVNRLTFTMPKM